MHLPLISFVIFRRTDHDRHPDVQQSEYAQMRGGQLAHAGEKKEGRTTKGDGREGERSHWGEGEGEVRSIHDVRYASGECLCLQSDRRPAIHLHV